MLHATTVATNAVLERKGARIAYVTTAGFRAEKAPMTFLASKTFVAVLMGIVAATYCWMKAPPLAQGEVR